MISLSALAALHSEYADDLARTVEPVSVGAVTIGGAEPVLMGTVNLSRDSTYRESIDRSAELLKTHRGNVTHAAKEAQKDRRAFGRLIKKYQISKLS